MFFFVVLVIALLFLSFVLKSKTTWALSPAKQELRDKDRHGTEKEDWAEPPRQRRVWGLGCRAALKTR